MQSTIDVGRKDWLMRWFFWSLKITDEFTGGARKDSSHRYTAGVNRCPMWRTNLVWAPGILVLHLITYALAIFTLTLLPVTVFGFTGYATTLAIIAATFGLFRFGRPYIIRQGEVFGGYYVRKEIEWEERRHEKARLGQKSVFLTVWEYLKTVHDVLCPYYRISK